MSTTLIVLAVLMFAVTYPSRALGLLTPGLDRLPRWAFDYLQLVGPAVLAALAAVSVMVVKDANGLPSFHVGIEWVAVLACTGGRGLAAQPVPRPDRRGGDRRGRAGGRDRGPALTGAAGEARATPSPGGPRPRSR